MDIEETLKHVEYPVFIRGSCVEEAIWLLGKRRNRYKIEPGEIYAFPIVEGFQKAKITPIKPIPKNYSLQKLRDEILLAAEDVIRPSLYYCGDEEHCERFMEDDERMGVAIYFNPKVIKSLGYEQDRDVLGRPHLLCAVKISVPPDFDPTNVCLVEPLGPTDYDILDGNIPNHRLFTEPRFKNKKEKEMYISRHLDDITFCSEGFNFP